MAAPLPLPLQTGVYWHEPTRTDLLFITLQKTERDYSPTTRYLDYAISDRLFHWETQASTAADSERARNYIDHAERGRQVARFIRTAKRDTGDAHAALLQRRPGVLRRAPRRSPGAGHLAAAAPAARDVFSAFRATVA